jgi:hypothetical protein
VAEGAQRNTNRSALGRASLDFVRWVFESNGSASTGGNSISTGDGASAGWGHRSGGSRLATSSNQRRCGPIDHGDSILMSKSHSACAGNSALEELFAVAQLDVLDGKLPWQWR